MNSIRRLVLGFAGLDLFAHKWTSIVQYHTTKQIAILLNEAMLFHGKRNHVEAVFLLVLFPVGMLQTGLICFCFFVSYILHVFFVLFCVCSWTKTFRFRQERSEKFFIGHARFLSLTKRKENKEAKKGFGVRLGLLSIYKPYLHADSCASECDLNYLWPET